MSLCPGVSVFQCLYVLMTVCHSFSLRPSVYVSWGQCLNIPAPCFPLLVFTLMCKCQCLCAPVSVHVPMSILNSDVILASVYISESLFFEIQYVPVAVYLNVCVS